MKNYKIFFLFIFFMSFIMSHPLIDAANKAFALKKYKKTEILLFQAQKTGVNRAIVNFNLGNLYYRWGKINKAINHYKKVQELAPYFKGAYLNVGKIYYLYKDYKRSLDTFKLYYDLDHKDQEILLLIGDVYKKLQMYSDAEIFYDKAILSDPLNSEVYIAKSFLYDDLNDKKKALDVLLEGLKKNPTNLQLQNQKAIIYKELGDYRSSMETYSSLLKVVTNKEQNNDYFLSFVEVSYQAGYTNLAINNLIMSIQRKDLSGKLLKDYVCFLEDILYSNKSYEKLFIFYQELINKNKTLSFLGTKKLLEISKSNGEELLVSKILIFSKRHHFNFSHHL